jgi:hypothetical protein
VVITLVADETVVFEFVFMSDEFVMFKKGFPGKSLFTRFALVQSLIRIIAVLDDKVFYHVESGISGVYTEGAMVNPLLVLYQSVHTHAF